MSHDSDPQQDPHEVVREEIRARVQQEWEAAEARRAAEFEATATRLRAITAVRDVLSLHYPPGSGVAAEMALERAARIAVGIAEHEHDPIGQLLRSYDTLRAQQMSGGALRATDDRKPLEFAGDYRDDGSVSQTLSWESCVYQAVGAASVCWTTMEGAGVFRDDRAREVAEALLERSGQSRDTQVPR